jgi:hypothetical protein
MLQFFRAKFFTTEDTEGTEKIPGESTIWLTFNPNPPLVSDYEQLLFY